MRIIYQPATTFWIDLETLRRFPRIGLTTTGCVVYFLFNHFKSAPRIAPLSEQRNVHFVGASRSSDHGKPDR